jgi:hypothetical protein
MDIQSLLPTRKTIKLSSLTILFTFSVSLLVLGGFLQNWLIDLKKNLALIRIVGNWLFGICLGFWVILAIILGFLIKGGRFNHVKTILILLMFLTIGTVFGGMFSWHPEDQIIFSNLAFSLGVIGSAGAGFVIGEVVQHFNEVRNQSENLSNKTPILSNLM